MKKKQQSPLWRSPLNSTHVVLSWFTSDVNVGVTVNERLDVNMQLCLELRQASPLL